MEISAYFNDLELRVITEFRRFVFNGGQASVIDILALTYTENFHCHIKAGPMGLLMISDGTLVLAVLRLGAELKGVELRPRRRKCAVFGFRGIVSMQRGVGFCILGALAIVFLC